MAYKKIKELIEDRKYGKAVLALEEAYHSDNGFLAYGIPSLEEEIMNQEQIDNDVPDEMVEGGEIEIKSEDEQTSPDDAVSLLDIFGIYNNKFRTSFAKFISRNEGFIDRDAHFCCKTREFNTSCIQPAMKMLNIVFDGDEQVKSLEKLLDILCDRGSMAKCMGTKDAPFVYEGIQMVFGLKLLILMGLVPNHLLNTKADVNEIVDTLGNEAIKKVFQVADDIIEMKNAFGKSIVYVDAPKSEITGHAVDKITGTIFGNSAVMCKKDCEHGMVLSGESIENLLTIKNNGGLVDCSLLFKGLALVAKLCENISISSLLKEAYAKIRELLGASDINNAKDSVDSLVEWARTSILMPLDVKMNEVNNDPEIQLEDPTQEEPVQDPEAHDGIDENGEGVKPSDFEEDDNIPNIKDFD